MLWVLIIIVSGTYGGGPAMQTFGDKGACEAALKSADDMTHFPMIFRGMCVPYASPKAAQEGKP